MNEPRTLDNITLTVKLTRDEYTPDRWTSRCVELDIISAGSEPHTAFEALSDAISMSVDHRVKYRNETATEAIQRCMKDAYGDE